MKQEMSSGDLDGLQISREVDDKEKEEESKHFQRIVNAFQYYRYCKNSDSTIFVSFANVMHSCLIDM